MNPETISVGIVTTVVGLGVVFSVLIILSLVIALLAKLTAGRSKKKAAPAPVAAAPAAAPQGLNPKTVAAIMAAISAASGRPVAELKFTAIRRVNSNQNAWSNSGTSEIINTRQNYL